MTPSEGPYRKVYINFWHRPEVQGLSDSELRVALYCLTGPQSNSLGVFRLSTAVAVEDMPHMTALDFDRAFLAVCDALEWQFDPSARVLYIPTWIDENPPQSPNVCVSWRKLLGNVPDCEVKADAVDTIHRVMKDKPEAFRKAFGSYRVSLSNASGNSKAKTKANQGSGIRDFQESGNREQAALRAVAHNGRKGKAKGGNQPDANLLLIAKEALETPGQDRDYYIDHILFVCRENKIETPRTLAALALDAALASGGALARSAS